EFDGSFSNTNAAAGAISVSSAATLKFTQGATWGATTTSGAGTIAVNGGTLSLGSNASTIAGGFAQDNSIVDGTTTLTVSGSASFTSGRGQTGNGKTDLKAGGSLANNALLGLDGGRVLQNDGTFALGTNSAIYLGYNPFVGAGTSGSVNNTATGTVDLQGD